MRAVTLIAGTLSRHRPAVNSQPVIGQTTRAGNFVLRAVARGISCGSVSARQDWIDVAKGGTVLCVIFAHVITSALDANLIVQRGPWGLINAPLYTGMMATFMYLAGACAKSRFAQTGRHLTMIGLRLVWPYLIWGGLFLVAQELVGDLRNEAGTVAIGLSLLWTPIAWPWYLYALTVFQLIGLLLRGHPRLFLAVACAAIPLTAVAPTEFGRQLAFLLVFYALGANIGLHRPWHTRWAAKLALGGGALGWALDAPYYVAPLLPAAYFWMSASLDWSARARGLARNVLRWLGQRSFAIYISHFFFVTATRIILLHVFGITNFAVHLPLAFSAGLAGSLALLIIAQRLGFAPILGFGTLPDTGLQRSAKAVAVA